MNTDINKILKNFCRLEHVEGALLLDPAGKVVDHHFIGEKDCSPVVDLILKSIDVGGKLVDYLGKAPVTQQYFEFKEAQITAENLAGGFVLVIMAQTGANLGRVRLEIRKNKSAVENLLAKVGA